MAVPAGTRLGVYEVGALLGAGGMGEVCRIQIVLNWLEELKARAPAK